MNGKPHVVFFDLETRKLAQDVGGWDALKQGKGGISVLAIWDSTTPFRIHTYDDHSIVEAALHLESADVIVSYNGRDFDIPIVEGILKRKLAVKEHLDILQLIRTALKVRGVRGGNKLDEVGKRTLGRGKSEKSELAPALSDAGEWGRLVNYCIDDVDLTREVFEHIRTEGGVIDVNGEFLPLDLPEFFKVSGA
jgi:DEAD/DEAH box helicase domain-containing protein